MTSGLHLTTRQDLQHTRLTLAGFLLVLFAILVSFFFWQTRQYAIEQHAERLDDFLALHKAMHQYIENQQKPVFYDLMQNGTLDKEFFDKRGLSFTYIARNTHRLYNTNRQAQGLMTFDYKLASKNPRNPLNQANALETRLLDEYNAGRKTPYRDLITLEDGQQALYYATPIAPNAGSCLRCHSDPRLAPASMVAEYGDSAGFGETIGHIRAIISLTVPLEHAFADARQHWLILSGITLVILSLLYAIISFFLTRLHRQQHIIHQQNQRLHLQAHTDTLTGLFNRRQLELSLSAALSDPQPASVILLDIDHFKSINDTYGHNRGDEVLQTLANQLNQLPAPISAYRYGGEEFLLLLPGQDSTQAAQLAETLRQTIASTDFPTGQQITISLGVATRQAQDSAHTLIARADDLLYLAKQHGRNRVETDQLASFSAKT